MNQNARTTGLFAKTLTGNDAVRYAAAKEYSEGEILQDSFYLLQSKIMGVLENDVKFSKDAKTLLSACQLLVEQERLSEEFVDDLRLKLAGFNLDRLAKVFATTVSLAKAGVDLDKSGSAKAQLDICKGFIIDVLKASRDKVVLGLAVSAIARLKLEAGLPVEELESLLERAQGEEGVGEEVEQTEEQATLEE